MTPLPRPLRQAEGGEKKPGQIEPGLTHIATAGSAAFPHRPKRAALGVFAPGRNGCLQGKIGDERSDG